MKFSHMVLGLSCLVTGLTVQAQEHVAGYPQRSISLSVPYGSGGSTDGIARQFARLLEAELGQPVVILNQPGATGTLQMGNLARAKPDGYTIGFYSYSTATFTSQLLKVPYKREDFELLGGVAEFSYGIVARPDSPINNINDMIAKAKSDAGVFYGVTGAPNNFPFLQLQKVTGGRFDQITYKSSAESINAVIGGFVDVALQGPSEYVELVKAGKLKVVASASNYRLPWFPDTPTIKEQGFDFGITGIIGIAAPKGIPEDVKNRLQAAIHKVVSSNEYGKFLVNRFGIKSYPASAAEFSTYIDDGYSIMKNMITTYDIKGL
ncbi:tripartite tricarboxylate transporter substrate binding protein [Advenella mimigardefordensis]|uniref:Putative Bug-like extracytoplasmic solute binding receptor, TTT family n=1 Tax=Advenella mimigardefordensis (strain DSM 17166 / LMG 22922 / DPN7) TaxID=1247726 RepID=W0PAR9_ADVMD|nr:tripartite tricarboxylate transporter substrate binding protein [Advenella mimigardefordensis]AHG62515.1 putative Bug-like extracytoplasmic solute binding receptor, TTT family [Advenella mimigardefordensis DPN7]